MLHKWKEEYDQKLMTADEAVKLIQNGDNVYYPPFVMKVPELDAALARRKDELEDVKLVFATLTYVPETVKADPMGRHFRFTDGSFSAATRGIRKNRIPIFAVPSLYHETTRGYYTGLKNVQVVMIAASPMDKNGYFQLGIASSNLVAMLRQHGGLEGDLKVLLEVNDKLPRVQGDNFIHVSDVTAVVEEADSKPLSAIPPVQASEIDHQIAEHIMGEMMDGACIQLGIGGLPNIVGKMIADSDLKDLGCHTEMFVDAYLDMFNAGKLTNMRKQNHLGKSVFTFAMGSEALYDFVDNNPAVECLDVGYVNNPYVIAQNDRVVSICSCLNVDMFGNVSSESDGYKQISGTGGALDYHYAAFHSNGGKAFMCMPSTSVDKEGNRHSNIVAAFKKGTQITVPANMTNYIVTEYGIANMKQLNTRERINELLKICHPDFRQELMDEATKAGIWCK